MDDRNNLRAACVIANSEITAPAVVLIHVDMSYETESALSTFYLRTWPADVLFEVKITSDSSNVFCSGDFLIKNSISSGELFNSVASP